MAQQQWEADQRLRVEATRLAAQTSTQTNAEFRALGYDISAEMDDLIRVQMQEFAIKTEEAIDAQTYIIAQEGDIRRREHAPYTLVNNLESKLRTQSLESSNPNFDFEAIDADLLRRLYYAQTEGQEKIPQV